MSRLLTQTIFVLICLFCFNDMIQGQEGQGQSQDDKSGNLRRRRRDRPVDVSANRHSKSLVVYYPMKTLTSDEAFDFRKTAVYDEEIASRSSKEKDYIEVARAQDQEDVWLYEHWFYGMKNGVILESGALDGLLFSTSYMFENYLNWTTVHVEADPNNFSKLKSNRINSVNINGALCSESRLLHYSSLGVMPVRGFVEFMSPSFLKKWHGKIYNNVTKLDDLPTVQCLPVKSLFRTLGIKHIDIWILDIEGAEESALRGTDFNEVQINAVAMECDQHDISKNQRKTDILEANGFKCDLVERNCMCKHNKYEPHTSPSISALRKWDGQKWSGVYNANEAVKKTN